MKKLFLFILIAALSLGLVPVWTVAAEEETTPQLATYEQDFTDLEKVKEDFTAYSVYTMGNESEPDSIDADQNGSGYWYLDTIDGQPAITRKNEEAGEKLDSGDGTNHIRVLTFTRQKFVNFELEVEFKRGSATIYWAGIGFRQLMPGKYFLEDGAGIFCQQEGQTTLWGTDGVGGPHQTNAVSGFQPNAFHKLRVVCNGLTLEIYVDGVNTMTRTLPRTFFRKGYVSLISVNNDSSYRNFKITELPTEKLPPVEQQAPKPDAGTSDSLSNLSGLPSAERVELPGDPTDLWPIAAAVTGVIFAVVLGFGLYLLFGVLSKSKAAKAAAAVQMNQPTEHTDKPDGPNVP